ncbi:MAG: pyridoxamine 5'-phosphate oxidase family protein [Pseudomonadota bacterium]
MPLPKLLSQIPDWTIAQLVRAAADRKSTFKWPVLVTGSHASGPSGRVVVLRRFNAEKNQAVIYTDRRTSKVQELADNPRAELVFFDPKNLIQIRLRGNARVYLGGPEKDDAFDKLPARGQSDYSTLIAPGTQTPDPQPERDTSVSREQFAIIEIDALEYDILSLEREGHRRVQVIASDQSFHASWVVP